jgi:hypothetical protein
VQAAAWVMLARSRFSQFAADNNRNLGHIERNLEMKSLFVLAMVISAIAGTGASSYAAPNSKLKSSSKPAAEYMFPNEVPLTHYR